ncbi:MAG: hypothetical protein ACI90V_011044, partial [Bacillariaceae sp.]
MIEQSAESPPEGKAILYGIIFEPPNDINSAHTVKFKVDNPFANHTDIYIKHMKKVGKYALDPNYVSMPFTAGCKHNALEIEAGCYEYKGVEPFTIVDIYFASNTDLMVQEISSGGDVQIDKCCKPPYEEYTTKGYGIIKYTFEIKCTCVNEPVNERVATPDSPTPTNSPTGGNIEPFVPTTNSSIPSSSPSCNPSIKNSTYPSPSPSSAPSGGPSGGPSSSPSASPSGGPSASRSASPSG